MKKWLYKFLKKKHQVSIIIPTYKNTEFLLECLNSVIISCKKCCEFEILLGIDDCQDTLKFVSLYSIFKNKNISVYYFSKNIGPYVIRNTLATKAKYDNIFFFDSDDIMMPDTVDVLLKYFDGKEMLKFKFYNFENAWGYYNLENLSISPIFAHGVFLIKKEKFFKLKGFFGWRCGADTEFTERCEGLGYKIYFLDVPIFYRRYHEMNITKKTETAPKSEIRQVYKNIILEKRKTGMWNSPHEIQSFRCSKIVI